MIKKAVILAAGEGTRLKPFTENAPKAMIPVANKPVLEYVVNALVKSGIHNIVIVVGYKKESILEYFGDGNRFGAEIEYVTQKEQVGTAHALLQAEKYMEEDNFLVLPGDNIVDEKGIIPLIKEKHEMVLLVKKHPQPSKYGVVEIEEGVIKNIMEKPVEAKSNIVSTGIYKLNKKIWEILHDCAKKGIYDLTNVIQEAIRRGHILKAVENEGKWMDIVYPWDLIHVNAKILQEISYSTAGKIEENVVIKGKVCIGEDTVIRSGCYIVGPVVIGKNCEIGPNVCIFPSTSIGDNVTINPFTEIKNSILMEGVSIGSNSLILSSVIGKGCFIGTHFSTISGGSILKIGDEYTEVENIGAFVGDGTIIKSNVVLRPATRIGVECEIEVGNVVGGDIRSRCKVV